jgi:UDP-glucose 4-epimerase
MEEGTILIIGGSGFIGEHLVSELTVSGRKVSIFTRNSSEPLEEMISKSSAVVFLAPPDHGLLKQALLAVATYTVGTFLYSSTVLLYKGGGEPEKETGEIFPVTEYAKKKHEEEKIISDFKKEHPEINVLVTRLGNVYGGIKNKGFIGRIFEQLASEGEKKEIIIAGDGTQMRDYVFVDDVAKALALLLIRNEKANIVNVSTGIGHSLLEVIECVEKTIQKKIVYRFGPEVSETHSVVADNTKLKKILTWTPETSLADGLRKTHKRYIVNATSANA